MATEYKTGGEVDAFCNKCKLTLAHTILAMVGQKIVRVRCNTCQGEHVFRGTQPGAAAKKPRAPRAPKEGAAPKVVMGFEEQLAGKNVDAARTYSPKDSFAVDEVLRHPTFGLGIVTGVRSDKIDVNFKMAQKTLVHGKGGGSAEKPHFAPPKGHHSGPADKPYVEGEEPGPEEQPAAEESGAEEASES
jgi:hypothetical protein